MSPNRTHPKTGKPLPDIGLKWGKTPNTDTDTDTDTNAATSSSSPSKDPSDTTSTPDFSTYYTPAEQAKLRAKGVNPTLKAEMEWNRQQSQGKGFWGKVAGTAMGGGWIK